MTMEAFNQTGWTGGSTVSYCGAKFFVGRVDFEDKTIGLQIHENIIVDVPCEECENAEFTQRELMEKYMTASDDTLIAITGNMINGYPFFNTKHGGK